MKKVISFLKSLESHEIEVSDLEKFREELSPEELELVEAVVSLLTRISHQAAELGFCSAGALYDAKKNDDHESVVAGLKAAAAFNISPGLILKFINDLDLNIDPAMLLSSLVNFCVEKFTQHNNTPENNDSDIDRIQSELIDKIRKFNQN